MRSSYGGIKSVEMDAISEAEIVIPVPPKVSLTKALLNLFIEATKITLTTVSLMLTLWGVSILFTGSLS